jgi:hypothetical protein
MKMKNNSGDVFELLEEYEEKIGKRKWVFWVIRFEETGYTRIVYKYNAEKGKVRDLYKPSFCGIGYQGEFKKISYWKQARRLWENMLKRCYDSNYKAGYYGKGYSVDKRWHCFANFLEDLPGLGNFHKWIEGFNKKRPQYNLDKDLKLINNKVYCKQYCSFVLERINKAAGARKGKPYTKNPKQVK